MYVHCKAYTCSLTENSGICNQNCQNVGRRRRDASQGAVEYNVYSQAIIIIDSDLPLQTVNIPPTSQQVSTIFSSTNNQMVTLLATTRLAAPEMNTNSVTFPSVSQIVHADDLVSGDDQIIFVLK